MGPDATDEQLIIGCLEGEPAAWSTFVDRFAGLVHWSIRRCVDDAPGGQDDFCREVFQEFFQRLIEGGDLSRLRETRHVRKYISVSAGHLALDRLKSRRRLARKMKPAEELL